MQKDELKIKYQGGYNCIEMIVDKIMVIQVLYFIDQFVQIVYLVQTLYDIKIHTLATNIFICGSVLYWGIIFQ